MRAFIRQLRPALIAVIVFTVLTGLVYPMLITGIGKVAFSDKADGQLIYVNGQVVVAPKYFHSRPSAAGAGYDGSASSGSNLGPLNPDLLKAVNDRAVAYRTENGLAVDAMVPVDAVTSSGSGLDPHISIANARLQANRVAVARGLPVAQVIDLISRHTDGRSLGVLGEPGVNVLVLNVALDALVK
jgi:K+-transporting ATPase ATPase C chain